jgi:hypothetical protein
MPEKLTPEMLETSYNDISVFLNEKHCEDCRNKVEHFHAWHAGACGKKIQLAETGWKKAVSVDKIHGFNDGHLHEDDVRNKLTKAGYNIARPTKTIWLPITGHDSIKVNLTPDGVLGRAGYEDVIWENKAIGDYSFDMVARNGIPKPYRLQGQLYLYAFEIKRAIFSFKNRHRSNLIWLEMEANSDELQEIVQKYYEISVANEFEAILPPAYEKPEFECSVCDYWYDCWPGKDPNNWRKK